MLIVQILAGIIIGLALGLVGGGGSILLVPILVYVVGLDVHAAIASSLAIVGINAAIGTTMHWRAGNVQVKQSLVFGGAGMAGAYLGAHFSQYVSETVLMVFFGLMMMVVGGLMFRPLPLQDTDQSGSDQSSVSVALGRILLTGVGVGVLTGFLGVGGGFVIVPALVMVLGMSMSAAIGSSLLVIALNALAGLLGHMQSGSLDWGVILVFTLAGVAGLLLGTYLHRQWSSMRLRRIFAGMVVTLASVLLVVNVPALF
jgi:hypothetical protein